MKKKTFSYNEAFTKCVEYFKGDELAANVFLSKYALTDNDGNLIEQTPDDMHKRLAREFARVEKKYPNSISEEEIYSLFKDFKYVVPQGSPMSAIGNEHQIQSSSNCYVLPSVSDSYSSILRTDEYLVQISKRRGGNGVDVSHIRPKGMVVNNAAKTTTGIGVFMERFSNSIREVGQAGRRGALMMSIDVHHPEVETFINIKKDKTKVTGANISVKLTDDFMTAVKEDKEYEQYWPMSGKKKISKFVKARDIWNQIIHCAWESAEPGILFWDNAIKNTPSDAYKSKGFGSVSTNPCGEIILSPFDSCRLMAINLSNFVENKFQPNATFDYEKFSEISEKSQKLMDDLIDLELEQIDKILKKIESDSESDDLKSTEKNMWLKIRKACAEGRRTGLGITALGDTLASLNIVYGSDESIEITEKIYKTLAQAAYKSSIVMAQERGSFPVFEYELEKNHPFISKIVDTLDPEIKELYKKHGRRNIALTTTAPTGSVSVLTKTTSGIEPAYLLKYTRRKKINPNDKDTRVDFVDQMGDKWQEFPVYHHGFKEWMDITGKTEIEDSPYYGATSNDVNWNASVMLQAVAQKWICHSISKTCNLPNNATEETVAAVYMEAYDSGCKGFTVYRDGCRTGVLVASDSKEKDSDEIGETNAPKRPNKLPCDIHQTVVKGEAWTIFVGKHHNRPYEIFGGLSKFVDLPKKSKEGFIVKDRKKQNKHLYNLVCGEEVIEDIVNTFENPTEGEFTRILSLSLRHGVPIQYITEQLQKDDKNSDMYSFGRVISRVLKTYIKEGTKSSDKNCPNCGAEGTVIYKEGCKTCSNCGNSKCG